MQIRNLGGSGLRVSAVGLGCNNFGGRVDLEGTRAVVDAALDAGVTLFDTADALELSLAISACGGGEPVPPVTPVSPKRPMLWKTPPVRTSSAASPSWGRRPWARPPDAPRSTMRRR